VNKNTVTPFWDVQQQTLQWFELKHGKIGGSTSKGLLVDSDTLLDEILSTRLEAFEMDDDSYESKAMLRGNELEPLGRKALSQYSGYQFLECGWLQSDIDIIGISPDGITDDLKVSCEIKCPGRSKHTKTLRENILPIDHVHQIVHNFTVNPFLELCYFGSFRPESAYQLFVKPITRDTLINLGTKAKPVNKTVNEWSDIMRGKAIELETNIQLALDQLNKF